MNVKKSDNNEELIRSSKSNIKDLYEENYPPWSDEYIKYNKKKFFKESKKKILKKFKKDRT